LPIWPNVSAARDAFTEGRNVRQWLEHLYEPTRKGAAETQPAGPTLR
jgi:biotin/methionine sulfoxide reductase